MPANYSTNARHARLTSCLNATTTAAGASVNGQTAGGGLLVIGTSGLSGVTGVLATITLTGTTPFSFTDNLGASPPNTVASEVNQPLPGIYPSANGTAALAELRDSAGNTVISGLTVGVGGGFDVQVSTTSLLTTVQFQVQSIAITTQ